MIPQKSPPSQTLALNQKVKDLVAAGENIVSFAAGESDFECPPWAIEEAYKAMKAGQTKYAPSQGVLELREALAKDAQKRLGSSWVNANNIIITGGAKQGIHLILSALLDEGDEVLVPAPYWVSYPGITKSVRGVSVKVETQIENGFFPTVQELSAKYTAKTKVLVIASPNNPTGGMIAENQLKDIVNWCCEKKVLFLYDELYERLVFSNKKHHSPLSFMTEAQSEWVVCINAFSKAYSMTGWRIGYLTSHKENIKALTALQSQVITCLPGFLQKGCVAALSRSEEYLAPLLASFKKRREVFFEEVEKVPGAKAFPPEAAFYVLVDVRDIMKKKNISTDTELATRLLETHKVAVNPGASFGMPGFIRFTFSISEELIREGLKRFKNFAEA